MTGKVGQKIPPNSMKSAYAYAKGAIEAAKTEFSPHDCSFSEKNCFSEWAPLDEFPPKCDMVLV
jgi:hypothetical protein